MKGLTNRSQCIKWTGCLNGTGYGIIYLKDGSTKMAHRAIWEGVYGKIPPKLCIDHLCRVRACINIHHMRVVTLGENVLCGFGPSAINARKTICKHGHPLVPENLYTGKGFRECRTCQRRIARKSQLKLKRLRNLAKD